MSESKESIDWSDDTWKQLLVFQRRCWWRSDTIEMMARWIGFRPGMKVADIGCGLGFLGYTFWPYFGKGGSYIGVDKSSKLLEDTSRAAKDWAQGGTTEFIVGDAYDLPLDDDFADIVTCQTLLMHLEKPAKALAEMVRVVKPGGVVLCNEPDNLSSELTKRFMSIPELGIEDQLLSQKVSLLKTKGRIKLGRGDYGMGNKLPHMMRGAGLTDIDIRMNDNVFFVEPPYDNDTMKHRIDAIRQTWFDEKRHKTMIDREEEEFIAGGGSAEEFARVREIVAEMRPVFQKQIEDREYYSCGGTFTYLCRGRKVG